MQTCTLAFIAALIGCGSPPTPRIANRSQPVAARPASLRDKIIAVSGHVIILKSSASFPEYRDVIRSSMTIAGVISAGPFTFTEMSASSAKQKALIGIAVKGIVPLEGGKAIAPYLVQGELRSLDDASVPSMIVGDVLARTLGVHVGDDITVELAPDELSAWGARPPPGSHTFRVTGMFHLDFDEYDRRLAYASLSVMQGVLGRGDNAMGVELRVKDAERAGAIAGEVEKLLGGPPYEARDWYTLNQAFFEAQKSDR